MSLFKSIMSKIFGNEPDTQAGKTTTTQASRPLPKGMKAVGKDAGKSSASAAAQPAAVLVDVEATLVQLAAKKGGGGNWRTSIVDLLKLLDLDSSLSARKELAVELGVRAGADGSAEQNIALQKAVMRKLAENGGKVPESLRS
jgi:hypothetical protein